MGNVKLAISKFHFYPHVFCNKFISIVSNSKLLVPKLKFATIFFNHRDTFSDLLLTPSFQQSTPSFYQVLCFFFHSLLNKQTHLSFSDSFIFLSCILVLLHVLFLGNLLNSPLPPCAEEGSTNSWGGESEVLGQAWPHGHQSSWQHHSVASVLEVLVGCQCPSFTFERCSLVFGTVRGAARWSLRRVAAFCR